jgi:hypothetical protein
MSSDQEYPVRSYEDWPQDANRRWIHAGNTFGAYLMKYVNDAVSQSIPADATEREREIADKVCVASVFTVMEILDGFYRNDLGDNHTVDYALISRVRNKETYEVVESTELAPEGDGLCMGFWGWREGDFGQNEWE